MTAMSVDETAQAHEELVEVRRLINECRSDLGIADRKPAARRPRRGLVFRLRGPRRGRRQAPVA